MNVIGIVAAILVLGATTASAQYLYGTGSNPNSHYVAPHTTHNGNYVSGITRRTRTTPNVTTTVL
jgi:hypothetical protein